MHLKDILVLLGGGIIICTPMFAQSPPGPAFEVASVKPNKSGARNSSSRTLPGGRGFTASNVTMRQFILNAYRLRTLQLTGGPGWIDSDRFDIDARAPESGPNDQVLTMQRALLAERFKLVVHTETKEQPIYALVLARSDGRLGPQMKPSALDCTTPGTSGRGSAGTTVAASGQTVQCGTNTSINNTRGVMRGGGRSLSELAAALANFVADRMVVDRTGLTQRFDFELRWTPDTLQPAALDGFGGAAPNVAAILFYRRPRDGQS